MCSVSLRVSVRESVRDAKETGLAWVLSGRRLGVIGVSAVELCRAPCVRSPNRSFSGCCPGAVPPEAAIPANTLEGPSRNRGCLCPGGTRVQLRNDNDRTPETSES